MQLKMNKSLNIFLVILLCVVSYVGLLLSLYSSKSFEASNSYVGATTPAGGGYSARAVSVGVGRSAGSDVAVPMSSRSYRGVRGGNALLFSHGSAWGSYVLPSLQGEGGSRLVTYMSSSQTMKSFGGSVGTSVSVGAGNMVSSSLAPAPALSVSMPTTSMYAYTSKRTSPSFSNVLSVSNESAVASAIPYAGIGNTTVAGPLGMKGRRNLPGIGGEYLGWLSSELWGYGDGYGTFGGGSEGVTLEMLKELYIKATGDTDFSNQQDWEAFLAWFNSNQSDDQFGWYWVPMSDAIPFVLLLCLVYVVVVSRRNKIAKKLRLKFNLKIQK